MAYNNYRSQGGFNNGGYRSNNSSYNKGGGYQQRQNRKRSGARTGVDKKGRKYTTGWNKSKFAGFVTFLCIETKNSVASESKSGNQYVSVMVKVRKQMSPEETTNGLMNVRTGQVTIESMGIVINPKAPNGGYCGRYGKK